MKKLMLLIFLLIGSYKSFSQNDTLIKLTPNITKLVIKDLLNHDRLFIENNLLSLQISNLTLSNTKYLNQIEHLNIVNSNYKQIELYNQNQLINYNTLTNKLKKDLDKSRKANKTLKFIVLGLGVTAGILIIK